MTRPTQCCKRCGEFVTTRPVTAVLWNGRAGATTNTLIHIDGSGTRIYRNHAPVV